MSGSAKEPRPKRKPRSTPSPKGSGSPKHSQSRPSKNSRLPQPHRENKRADTPARRRTVVRSKWFKAALATVSSLMILSMGFVAFLLLPCHGDGSSVEVEWDAPESASEAADLLARAGLVRSVWLMALYLRVDGHWDRIDSGIHLLQNDMAPRTLLRRLRRLQGGAEVRVIIPEGFDTFDVARRLQESGVCSQRALLKAAHDATLMAELRLPVKDAEGYLFPATYAFVRNQSPSSIVRRMVNEAIKRHAGLFDEHPEALKTLHDDLGWNRHDILILASMVEKEAAVDEERPLIASVFLNRMRSASFRPKQRLQSDPTARYGCLLDPLKIPTCAGAEKGVTGPMVRDPANPYSTYAHAGLPPGPICNPGERSLLAVLTPAITNYLFFVARGNGRHSFSESFESHRDAIRDAQSNPR